MSDVQSRETRRSNDVLTAVLDFLGPAPGDSTRVFRKYHVRSGLREFDHLLVDNALEALRSKGRVESRAGWWALAGTFAQGLGR